MSWIFPHCAEPRVNKARPRVAAGDQRSGRGSADLARLAAGCAQASLTDGTVLLGSDAFGSSW
jgi:hypothetical protein